MNMPPVVSPQEWEAAREELLVKEKELTRARDALAAERRRMPRMAVEKEYALRGPERPGEPARPLRRAPSADRLPLLLRPRRRRLAGEGLPRLLVRCRPGRPPRPPERPRHHARVRLARAAARDRALEGADGLGDPLVHDHRRLRHRLRRRRVARHQRLLPRRRADLPHLLRRQPRRRGDGQHLEPTSTSRRSGARRSGRTRRRATRRPRRTSGGTSTTSTAKPSDRTPEAPRGTSGESRRAPRRPGPAPASGRGRRPRTAGRRRRARSGTMCSSSSSTSPAARYWLMTSAPPPTVTSLPAAAALACSRADSIPSVTKVNVVSESVSGSRSWWVRTKTGMWNGGSSPHHPRQGSSPHGPGPPPNFPRPMISAPTFACASSRTALLAFTSPPSLPWGSRKAFSATTQSCRLSPPSPSGFSSLWLGPAT